MKKKIKLSKNILKEDVKQVPTRNGFGDALVELGESNPKVVVLSADLAGSTKTADFAKKFPERFFEVGVAEQNMMGIAAGLALSGKIPFVSSYAVFSPGRNWDQLRVSVAYSEANVKIAGAHTGISVGPDGATHQALEDMAITRVIPNLVVVAPCDYEETRKATLAAANYNGPVYFRFTREKSPVFTTPEAPFEIGKAYVMREGGDVTLIGCGPLLYEALIASEELSKEGVEVEVINCHTLKPLDDRTILASVEKTKVAVTIEEHQVIGGLGGAVAELVAKKYPVPIEMVGIEDHFGESGEPRELLEKYHLNAAGIVKAVKKAIKRKK